MIAYGCGPAAAASANWIGVAQTVVVATSSTGKVSGKPFVFTQWSANGSGPATLKVPISSSGFRNLSGLGKAPIKDGYAVWNLHLTGPANQRSEAHFPTAKLPLQVSAAYEFNGKKVKAQDIVGKTGELKVSYTITNVTTKATKVTFANAFGNEETTTVNAPVPIAAIVNVTIPPDFTNLKGSTGVSANGNGNGTSTASWTLLLFDPLGGVKQSVSYQAHVTNALVPSATVEAAPLPPTTIPPLPPISEPGPPAVPTVTLGANLARLQVTLHAATAQLVAKASAALNAFKQVAVPAVSGVSRQAATVAGNLPGASAAAQAASINALNTATGLAQASVGVADASTRAAGLSGGLKQASAEAADASAAMVDINNRVKQHAARAADAAGRAGDLHRSLKQAAAEASDAASRIGDIRTGLDALPDVVKLTPAWRHLHATVVGLELRLIAHAARLTADAAAAGVLEVLLVAHAARLAVTAARADVERVRLIGHAARLRVHAAGATILSVKLTALSHLLTATSSVEATKVAPAAHAASIKLLGLVPTADALSTKAAQVATTIANATLGPGKPPKPIPTKQIGGGAKLDAAVGQLDGAITNGVNKVDSDYAYLTALNQRAAENKLAAGNAKGATAQAAAFVYSVSGANNTAHQTHLAVFIGGFALVIGLLLGISLYRLRRGLPSSTAPPKSSAAAA